MSSFQRLRVRYEANRLPDVKNCLGQLEVKLGEEKGEELESRRRLQ